MSFYDSQCKVGLYPYSSTVDSHSFEASHIPKKSLKLKTLPEIAHDNLPLDV
jgi:hypothetical protein